MSDFVRGLLFGLAALFAGFVTIFIALGIMSAILSGQGTGHETIALRMTSPLGAVALAFLTLTFLLGFSYGARRHTTHLH